MTRVAAQPGFFSRARTRVFILRAIVAVCATIRFASPTLAAAPPGSEIVNVATCRYAVTLSGGGSGAYSVASNPARTIVAPTVTFDGLVLSVTPPGAVAPGTALTYTLVADNRSGIPLTGAVLRLPLESDLGDPVSIAGTPGVSPAPTSTSWDPATRTVSWNFASIPTGGRVSVQVVAPVLAAVPPDTLVEEAGDAVASENPFLVTSNTVVTPVVPPVLEVLKRAERSAAAPGDPVAFTLEVRHTGAAIVVTDAEAVDTLPPGLAYIAGSGRVDGAPVEPTVSADGRTLRFALGTVAPGDVRTIRLAARVTALAQEGEVVNRAHAEARSPAGWPFVSGLSSAALRIVPGPFHREAVLAGRVFVDDNGNGLSDPGEAGVPGVFVAMEDGRGAVTDVTGRWHVEGVRPGLHVVRLDRDTLPETLRPEIVNSDFAGDRGSRFVEARPAALVVVDMPVRGAGATICRLATADALLAVPAAVLLTDDGRLRPAAEVHLEHAAQLLVERGERDPSRVAVTCDADEGDRGATEIARALKSKITSRVVEVTGQPKGENPREPDIASPVGSAEVPAADAEPAPDAKDPLEDVVRSATPEPAILSPPDGARASRSSIAVEVVYPVDTIPDLRVNGVPVPASRIGATSKLPSRGIAASRYVGVPLEEGRNRIQFRAVPSGVPADGVTPVGVTVGLPGRIAGLRIDVPESRWIADASTPGALRVEATDGAGMRVAEAPLVTLDVEGAEPLYPDADLDAPGFQIHLDDGAAVVKFGPRTFPGRVHARAFWESLQTETWVDVLPAGGRWRIVGLAEGRLAGEAGVEGDGGGPPGLNDEPADSGGRLAFVARGPVGQSSRLTVSVDTARERDPGRLFGYFEPDRFFPVYGDTSLPVEEAQRQGPVFARIDGPRGFAQYGDVATGLDRNELSRYDRRLEGVSGRALFGRTMIEGFAASTDQTVVRDVFAPDGTSGPYLLSRRPVVARSERVVLELRDRQRTDEVLLRQVKLADLDYDLDPESGTIFFRGPVPPFDASMNPFRIVVLYEISKGGDTQIAAGTRVSFRPNDRVETGISAVREQRVGDDLAIYGADLAWRPAPGTSVRAEVAATDEGAGAQTASRLDVQSRPNAALGWQASWRDVPVGFANPTLLGAPEIGSRRYGANLLWEPSSVWRLKGEAFRQQEYVSGIARTVAGIDAERRFPKWALFGGVRGVASDAISGSVNSAMAETGARGRLAEHLLGELSHRQVLSGDVAPGYPTRTALGLSWEIADGQRLVLRHEIESGDAPTRDRTSLGVESRVGANTTAHARYDLAGGATGATLRSDTGIETVVPLRRGASVNLFASRVDTTQGSDDGDFTTLGAGFEKRFGDSIFSSRYEISLTKRETRHVGTVAGAFRIGEPWTLFARERLFVNDAKSGPDAGVGEGLVGVAFRPVGKAWQALVRLDHVTRAGTATTAGGVVSGGVPSEPRAGGAPPVRPPGTPGVGTLYDRYATEAPDSIALNVAAGAQVTTRQRVALTAILRRVDSLASLGVDGSLTYLLGVHYTAQIHPRWTLGGSARRFAQSGSDTATYGTGIEVGWLAIRNLWLTGGYNVIGFTDPYEASGESTQRGPFVSLRFKFDEGSLENLRDLRLDRK